VTGSVVNTTFVKNIGIPIYDDDRSPSPINSMVYNNNRFFETSYPGKVYHDSLTPVQTADGLNSLVVSRSGSSTDKSPQNDNQSLASEPVIARLQIAPTALIPALAAGDSGLTTTSYLAYAWNGAEASLGGEPIANRSGVEPVTNPASYSLTVDGTVETKNLPLSPEPSVDTTVIPGSPNPSLSWDVTAGSFLHISADQGLTLPVSPSGIVQLPSIISDYCIYSVTREGGILKSVNPRLPILNLEERLYLLIGLNYPQPGVGVPIWNGGGDSISWTAQNNNPELIELEATSGTFESAGEIPLVVKISQPGQYSAQIAVDGGAAGTATVTVEILVIDEAYPLFLPGVIR